MSDDRKFFWRYGEKIQVARTLGVSRIYLSGLLSRRASASLIRAKQLELITGIPWQDWRDTKRTDHPAFTGEPLV